MNIRTLFLFAFVLGLTSLLTAQELKFNDLDASPMDMAHYPRRSAYKNYLSGDDADRTQKIKVLYCRPQVKGRTIFGDLVKYGEDWRLGANEATEVTFFQAVEIGNTYVPSGTYTLFAEPSANEWIIKLSTERFIAGTSNRDTDQDIAHVTVPVTSVANSREFFTIGFQKIDDGMVHMLFEWDKTRAALPINLNPPSLDGENASPMDLIQSPARSRLRNFIETEEELAANEPEVRVVYSRPQMKGRKIFGELLPYGEAWRLGANETTEITFFKKVMIGGEEIEPGRYGLFAVVNTDKWTFVIHEDPQTWGVANHDDELNVVSVEVPTEAAPETMEALSMTFLQKEDSPLELVVAWENTMARLPIIVMK